MNIECWMSSWAQNIVMSTERCHEHRTSSWAHNIECRINAVSSLVCTYSNHNTQFVSYPFGLKQGCLLSPGLFSMFINKIAVELSNVGQHGIQLQPGMLELFLLLFADDLALLSSTAIGLQNQLNQLSRMCEERLAKSRYWENKDNGMTPWQKRAVVFRRSKVRRCEQVYIPGVYLCYYAKH